MPEHLLSLPTHDRLEILGSIRVCDIAVCIDLKVYSQSSSEHFRTSADLFFKLLAVHSNLELTNIDMTPNDFQKALKVCLRELVMFSFIQFALTLTSEYCEMRESDQYSTPLSTRFFSNRVGPRYVIVDLY